MQTAKNRHLRSLALLLTSSSLGGATSVLVGYAGELLTSVILLPFVAPQLLSGLHVFWLVLAAMLVPMRGSATVAGALKGLIEASLFSHLGFFSFSVSLVEGAVVDAAFALLKKNRAISVYFAGGLSSASNLLIVQLLFLPPLPLLIYVLAYFAAFLSGLLFGGYLTIKVLRFIPANLRNSTNLTPQHEI